MIPRPIDRKRWRNRIVAHLEDVPRQVGVLDAGVADFGPDFDLAEFTQAFESSDPESLKRVRLLEGALTRLQGHIARLAEDGVHLAGLEARSLQGREPQIAPVLEALAAEGVISRRTSKRLVAIQVVRNRVEHAYVDIRAQELHAAIRDLSRLAPEFFEAYARWIRPFVEKGTGADGT